jgi:hypothetical protein
MSGGVSREGEARKEGFEWEKRGRKRLGGRRGMSARCRRGLGRERGGGGGEKGKKTKKETHQIVQKNKSIMLADKVCIEVNDNISNAQALQRSQKIKRMMKKLSHLSILEPNAIAK